MFRNNKTLMYVIVASLVLIVFVPMVSSTVKTENLSIINTATLSYRAPSPSTDFSKVQPSSIGDGETSFAFRIKGLDEIAEEFEYTGQYGTRLYQKVGWWPFQTDILGVYAGHELETVNIQYWQGIYAPTTESPNYGGLETGTSYVYKNGASVREFFVFHHLDGEMNTWTIDSTWISNYVRTIDGRSMYYVEVFKSGGQWNAWLYNFNTQTWESIKTETNDGFHADGWCMWELHMHTSAPSVPQIYADGIRAWDGSSWHLVDSTYGYSWSADWNPASLSSAYYKDHPNGNLHNWYLGPNV